MTDGTNVTVPAAVDSVPGSVTRNYSCTFASNPGSGTNTATATWDAAAYNTPSGTASGTQGYDFSGVTPSISNSSVTVTDTLGGNLGTASYTDPSPKEFTYSKNFTGVAGTCTNYDNTATITENGDFASAEITVCVGKDLTVSKTAALSYNRTYKWLIDKSVDDTRIEIAEGGTATFNYSVLVTPDGYTDSGYALSGTITISNPNDWEDIPVDVSDTLDQGGTCTITEAGPYVVPHSGSLVVHYTCVMNGPATKNTATVTWDKDAYFTPNGSVSAEITPSFSFTEINRTITVIDDKTDPAHPVTLGTWNWGEGAHTFTYSLTKSGVAGTCMDYTNTAVIDETDQSDAQTVTVCVGKDLTVSKTAAGTFNRTYQWSISKAVDKTTVSIADDEVATFNYTVNVAQTGVSDAGWTLAGVITLSNPNDWQAITLSSLTDVVDNGGTCSVAVGPYVVPAGGTLDVAYSCTYAAAPSSYSGTNTATANWNDTTYHTPSGTASGSRAFSLAQLGSTNKTIHVTDTLGGDLGTVTGTDAAPFATATFTYSHDFAGVGGTCTDYDNTATITETGQNDSKTVEVCVGLDLTVSKTAAGTFNRTYQWSISKAADKTTVSIADDEVATFNYTVNVAQTGVSDAGWTLAGSDHTQQPERLAGDHADQPDAMRWTTAGRARVVAGPYVVPASGTLDVAYSCSYASAPSSYSGINTATANWKTATYHHTERDRQRRQGLQPGAAWIDEQDHHMSPTPWAAPWAR